MAEISFGTTFLLVLGGAASLVAMVLVAWFSFKKVKEEHCRACCQEDNKPKNEGF